MSETNGTPTNGLAAALLVLQEEPINAIRSAENPHFRSKYATIEDCWAAARGPLNKAGLVVRQSLTATEEGRPGECITVLVHPATGETTDPVVIPILGGDNMQKLGSAITYARRYGLVVACNILTGEDDDGNSASAANGSGQRVTAEKPEPTEKVATAKQRGMLNGKAGEKSLTADQFANVLLAVAGLEPRTFDDEQQAAAFVNRQLDRLPARLVNPVLDGIKQTETEGLPV